MEENKKLTPRMWNLYKYIKFITLSGRYTDKEDICENVEGYKAEHNNNENGSFINCPAIYHDIKALNNSCEIEKIIVTNNNQIRLGNEQECIEYANKLETRALKLLKRANALKNKIKMDGQGKLISCQNRVIDENSKAREFTETYIKE